MKCTRKNVFVTIGISAALSVLFVFLLSRLFTIILISPDDIWFLKILSGSTTGTPDGHTYFLRYPLSVALAGLYRLAGGIPWYKLFLVGSLALSFFLVFARVYHIAAKRKVLYLTITLLFVFLIFSEVVVHLEWTAIAGVLGATAIFRFVTMPKQLSRRALLLEYGICAVLLLLCFCLRHSVAYLFVPLAGLCWLRELYEMLCKPDEAEKKSGIAFLVAFLFVCAVLVGAVMVVHKLGYSGEDWKVYSDYTKDRSALFDYYGYPDYETYADEYQAAGISYEAYVLMKSNYNFVVPCNNFEDMDIKPIANLARAIYTEDIGEKIQDTYKTVTSILVGKTYMLSNVVILILITCNFIIYRDKKVVDVLFVAGAVCWAAALMVYLAYDGRLPERVVRCIEYGLIMVLFGNSMLYWLEEKRGSLAKLSGAKMLVNLILVAAMLGAIGVQLYNLRNANAKQEKLAVAYSEILTYCEQNPQNVYFRDFWSFSQRGELFMNFTESNNYVSTGGWTYHSPVGDKQLENLDCKELYRAITEDQNVYYLVSSSRHTNVRNHLNDYFAAKNLPVIMELADYFETASETVYVMKFSTYTCVDMMDNFEKSIDCEVIETENGLSVITTGNDSQLYFSVPEFTGNLIGMKVTIEAQESTIVQMFTAEQAGMYYAEKSSSVRYTPEMDFCILDSFDDQPAEIRLDPTNWECRELMLVSAEMILSAPVLVN